MLGLLGSLSGLGRLLHGLLMLVMLGLLGSLSGLYRLGLMGQIDASLGSINCIGQSQGGREAKQGGNSQSEQLFHYTDSR